MSGSYETIIPERNTVKRFPTGIQELYLDVCEDGQPPIRHQRLTEKNLKQLIRKIHKRKTLGASLSCPDRDEDYFEIEVNPSWIAFEYVVNNGMEDEAFYSSFNPDYLDSEEESDTDTRYGSFMQMRYTMQDPKLAAKCVEYFARTGELYPGAAWLADRKESYYHFSDTTGECDGT